MNFKKIAFLGIIAVSSLSLAGCNLYKTDSSQTGGAEQSPSAAMEETGGEQAESGVITYSDSGFSPKSLNAKAGETVRFKNTSTKAVQVNSVPHPQHTLFPELNINEIEAGQSKKVTFTKAGTYMYHNHLKPSESGQITVE